MVLFFTDLQCLAASVQSGSKGESSNPALSVQVLKNCIPGHRRQRQFNRKAVIFFRSRSVFYCFFNMQAHRHTEEEK